MAFLKCYIIKKLLRFSFSLSPNKHSTVDSFTCKEDCSWNTLVYYSDMVLIKCSFSECRLQFADISSFCSHVNRHTPKNEEEKIEQFTCPLCPLNGKKSFLSRSKLKQHMETHQKPKPNKIYNANTTGSSKTFNVNTRCSLSLEVVDSGSNNCVSRTTNIRNPGNYWEALEK